MATAGVTESIETHDVPPEHKPMTPPTSEEGRKPDGSQSELSDLDLDDDDEDIEPAYYYDGGKIPVFEPVCSPALNGVQVHPANSSYRPWTNFGISSASLTRSTTMV